MTSRTNQAEYPLGGALEFLKHIWHLNHAVERLSRRMERALGVTAQQRLVIRCVGTYPGMTPGQLAALLHLDRGTISAALGRLESKKLLTRRRDPRDKRRVTLGLSAEGRALALQSTHTVEQAVEALIGSADASAITATQDVLRRLAALLDGASSCRP